MTNSIDEIRDADFLLVIGSNTSEAHPIIAMEMKRAVRRGAKLIVADPRRIGLADVGHLYLPLRVGSDVALLLGMAHVIESAPSGRARSRSALSGKPDHGTAIDHASTQRWR